MKKQKSKTLDIDPNILRKALINWRKSRTMRTSKVIAKFREWDDLTQSEQIALFDIIKRDYEKAALKPERKQRERPRTEAILETISNVIMPTGRPFTIAELKHHYERRHKTHTHYAVINLILRQLEEEGAIYEWSKPNPVNRIPRYYHFTDVLPPEGLPSDEVKKQRTKQLIAERLEGRFRNLTRDN